MWKHEPQLHLCRHGSPGCRDTTIRNQKISYLVLVTWNSHFSFVTHFLCPSDEAGRVIQSKALKLFLNGPCGDVMLPPRDVRDRLWSLVRVQVSECFMLQDACWIVDSDSIWTLLSEDWIGRGSRDVLSPHTSPSVDFCEKHHIVILARSKHISVSRVDSLTGLVPSDRTWFDLATLVRFYKPIHVQKGWTILHTHKHTHTHTIITLCQLKHVTSTHYELWVLTGKSFRSCGCMNTWGGCKIQTVSLSFCSPSSSSPFPLNISSSWSSM